MSRSRTLQPRKANHAAMFIRSQFLTTLPHPPTGTNLKGRTAIVTGGSSGLGLEAGRQLLALGLSRLILAVRSPKRGRVAAVPLQEAHPDARVDVWELEMDSYASIQKFAARCTGIEGGLDIAILNAGVAEQEFTVAAESGHEMTMQVNYQGTRLLALLLLPTLSSTSPTKTSTRGNTTPQPGRLTVINSAMSTLAAFPTRHERPVLASLDKDPALRGDGSVFDGGEAYNVSKLLGQIFLDRLAAETSPDQVVINMVEPGLVKGTSLFRNVHGVQRLALRLLSLAGRPAEVGALTYIDAAVVQGPDSHGCWVDNCQIVPLAGFLYEEGNKDVCDQVWRETMDEFRSFGSYEIVQALGR